MATINATMGIKRLCYAPVNTSDPKTMPASGFKDVDVYQDTGSFQDNDPETTEHVSETSSKKIILNKKVAGTLAFSIMDPTFEELVAFQGGTLDADKNTYSEPTSVKNIALALIVIPEDGKALRIPSANIVAKKNTTYSATGITLLEVTATPEYGTLLTTDVTIPGETNS